MKDIENITLGHGSHKTREEGMCAMEAVAWLAGEPHTDAPTCACPVVASAVRGLNDRIGDDDMRTRLLRPLLVKVVGSRADTNTTVRRGLVAADWAVRVLAPMALEAFGNRGSAVSLRACAPIVDRETARNAVATCAAAAYAAYAADAAARPAASAAAQAADAAAAAQTAAAYAAYAAQDSAYAATAAHYAAQAAAYAADLEVAYHQAVRMIEAMLDVKEGT